MTALGTKLSNEDAVRMFEGRHVRHIATTDHPRDRQLQIVTFIFDDESVLVMNVLSAEGFASAPNRTLGGEK